MTDDLDLDRRIESAVLDGVDSILSEEQKAQRAPVDALAPDGGAAAKARLANLLYLSHRTGKPAADIGQDYDFYRMLYARAKFDGQGMDDDGAFTAAVKGDMQKSREVRHLLEGDDTPEGRDSSLLNAAVNGALDGKPWAEAFSVWTEGAQSRPGFSPDALPRFEQAASRAHSLMVAKVEQAKPIVETIMAGLRSAKDGEGRAYGEHDSIDPVLSAPKDLRPVIYSLLQREAAKDGAAKGEGGQFWEAFGRGMTGVFTGTARTLMTAKLKDAEARLKEAKPGMEFGGRFKTFSDYIFGDTAGSGEGQVARFIAEPFLTNKVASESDIAAAREAVAKQWDRLQVSADIADLGKGVLDPIKPATWLQRKVWYPFAEGALPYVATGAFGAGSMALMYGSISDQRTREIQTRNEGMSLSDASAIGSRSAMYETGIEYLESRFALGGLAKTAGALRRAKSGFGQLVLRNVIAQGVGQNVMEGVQDFMPLAVQALSSNVPEVDWDKELYGPNGYWAQRVDTFFALLPVVVGGAVASTVRSKFSRGQLEQLAAGMDDVTLQAAGITEADRTAILGETDAVARLSRFDEARRRPDAAEARKGATRLEERQALAAFMAEELKARAGVRSLERTKDGWSLRMDDGKTVPVSSAEAADSLIRDLATAADVKEAEGLVAIADAWGGDSQSFSGAVAVGSKEGITYTRGGEVVREVTNPETLATLYAEATMDGAEDVNVLVNGSNRVFAERVADGAASIVRSLEVNRGGQPAVATLLHEQVEANLKAGQLSGMVSVSDMMKALNVAALALPVTEGAADQALRERIRRGAMGDGSETEMRETIVELAVADTLGRRKDGGRLPAGAVSTALNGALQSTVNPEELAALGKFRALLRAVRAYVRGVMGTVAGLRKARRDGSLTEGNALDELISKITGRDVQEQHNRAVMDAEVETPAGKDIKAAFAGMAAGAAAASQARAADIVRREGEWVISHPAAQAAALTNPAYEAVRMPDGSVKVTNVIDPATGEWVVPEAARESFSLSSEEMLKQAEAQIERIEEDLIARGIDVARLANPTDESGKWLIENDGWEPMPPPLVEAYRTRDEAGARALREAVSEITNRLTGLGLSGREVARVLNFYALDRTDAAGQYLAQNHTVGVVRGDVEGQASRIAVILGAERQERFDELRDLTEGTLRDAARVTAAVQDYFFPKTHLLADAAGGESFSLSSVSALEAVAVDELISKVTGGDVQRQYSQAIIDAAAEAGESFSISPITAVALDTLSRRAAAKMADPEQRLETFAAIVDRLDKIKAAYYGTRTAFGRTAPGGTDPRRRASLDKEQAMRQAIAREDARNAVFARFPILDAPEQANATAGPLTQAMLDRSSPPRGRIMSAAKAAETGFFSESTHGDYDGASGIPPWMFGGTLMPDQAAQEAFDSGLISDPTPDALWSGLEKEFRSAAGLRDSLSKAKEAMQEANVAAKQEAQDWRDAQDKLQKRDHAPRAVMLRNLATLDVMLHVLPPELRGRVGGYTAIAKLTTQESMTRELEARMDKLDDVLETHMRKEYTTALESLLVKAKPTGTKGGERKGGTIGVEGHRVFANIQSVLSLTDKQRDAHIAALETEAAAIDPGDTDALVDIAERWQVADYFAAWKDKTAADRARAYRFALETYKTGRNAWRTVEEARIAEARALGDGVIATLGKGGYAGTQTKKAEKGSGRTIKGVALDLKSFVEVLESMLGTESPLVGRWNTAVRRGIAAKADAIRAVRKRWKNAQEAATGKKGRAARQQVWEMANKQTLTLTKPGEGTSERKRVPIPIIEKLRDGQIDATAVDLTAAESADLIAQLDALDPKSTKEALEVIRESRGPAETVKLTEAEGVFVTMLAAQSEYSDALDKAGWTQEAVERLEESLSDAAKSLRFFLAEEYREGYAPIAEVFRRMFGVDLPGVKNYAPAAFYHAGAERVMDVTASGSMDQPGFRVGFTKNRKHHTAAPRLENAFATYFGHAAQTAHWTHLAEVSRELHSVFGRPDVKRAVEAAHGTEMLNAIGAWLKAIEGNGLQVEAGIFDKFVSWMTSQQAAIVLAWKIGTQLKQSSALLGAAYRMPAADFFRGMAKLTTGKLGWSEMMKSDIIQRRLESGFAPEVRAAMNQLFTAKPSLRGDFIEKGMELIGTVDAFFTAGSAAIAYDYHFTKAREAGLGEIQAREQALLETEDIVARTAQPAELTDRSLFELRQGAFGKLVFLFASEARQKSSLWLTAWGRVLTRKATSADFRVLAISHFILGPAMQAIGALWRDARDDDDDEWFDAENWDPLDFFKAIVAGPLGGLPLIGDAVSGYSNSGILGRFTNAIRSVVQIKDGPPSSESEGVEWYAKRITRVMQGLDATTGVLGSIADQTFSVLDNIIDDSAERDAKKQAAVRKADREARQAEFDALPDEQKALLKKQREARKAAGIERDAARNSLF